MHNRTLTEHPDTTFDGDGWAITGTALVDVDWEYFRDADIGGRDGWEASCDLVGMRLGGLYLTRGHLTAAFGEAPVARFEAACVERAEMEDAA